MNLRLAVCLALSAAACDLALAPEEEAALLAQQLTAAALPASPTNAHADDPAAAALGQRLFFDKGMSADGRVACASCHKADEGFSDSRVVSTGVDGRTGRRHSMPVTSVAYLPFLFWDGRADSAWSQPLQAIESDREMDFTRAEVAHFVTRHYAAEYRDVFGPLPSLAGVPARARPGQPAWDTLAPASQDAVQRIFTNAGKALEAYERRLTCSDTRFDRWARGEEAFTPEESLGAAAFVRDGCAGCHTGPAFSDGSFHVLGIPSPNGGERGRAAGVEQLRADPFNGTGAYSDDVAAGRARLATIASEPAPEGAFRTASLRGVAQRRFFGHAGHEEQLRDFIQRVYRRGGPAGDRRDDGPRDPRDPLLRRVNTNDLDALVAFLGTLDCPPVPADLLDPQGPSAR